MSSPWVIAPFGHSGSHAPQLMQSSVMMVAIGLVSPGDFPNRSGDEGYPTGSGTRQGAGGRRMRYGEWTILVRNGKALRPEGPLLPEGQGAGIPRPLGLQDRGDPSQAEPPREGRVGARSGSSAGRVPPGAGGGGRAPGSRNRGGHRGDPAAREALGEDRGARPARPRRPRAHPRDAPRPVRPGDE